MQTKDMDDWLSWMESFHDKEIELGLERVEKVAKRLGVISHECPVVVFAGTNGKGSCVAFTEAMLLLQGYQVGTYTSPHLHHYTERVRINGQSISDKACCEAFEQVKKYQAEVHLTYFEFSTLAALWSFKQAGLDFLLLEVGLGGRLDAVNVVKHDFSVLTSIGMDHCEYLGNTLDEIATEKVGIVSPNSTLICGELNPQAVIEQRVKQQNGQLYQINRDFGYTQTAQSWRFWNQTIELEGLPLPTVPIQNVATALELLFILAKDKIQLKTTLATNVLNQLSVPGRFQKKTFDSIDIYFDVAHNPPATNWLSQKMRQIPRKGKLFAVFGLANNKSLEGVLAPLLNQVDAWYVCDIDSVAGKPSQELARFLLIKEQKCVSNHPSVTEGLMQALKQAAKVDKILVFGSFYTVSEGLKALTHFETAIGESYYE